MKHCFSILVVTLVGISVQSQAETANTADRKITWGGFVDGQYAFDFNNPPNGDRAYTTQPARSNEFNINLAFVESWFRIRASCF